MKKVVSIMLLSVLSVLITSNSFAEGLTREQVKEELRIARLNGELNRHSEDYPQIPFVSTKTREQVKEELRIARLNGELDRHSEYYPQIPFVSTKTREQVKEELIEYRKSHPVQNEYIF